MPERSAAKQFEWLPSARAAYLETLEYVSRDDQQAARLIAQRVERLLAAIPSMPLQETLTAGNRNAMCSASLLKLRLW